MPRNRRFYSVLTPGIGGVQFWCVERDFAFRVGVPNPRAERNCFITIDPALDIQQQFASAFPIWPELSVHEIPLPPGTYYARMARPLTLEQNDHPRFPTHNLYTAEISSTVGQLISLVGKLRDICQVVEPVPTNLNTFGHAIRECLIIAATEVESHWKAVLTANGLTKERFTTNDYIKTLHPFKLDQYSVEVLKFPLCGSFSPFHGWEASAPTRSLGFYAAYNAVKHDREGEFAKATLANALESVCACFILAVAQFGYSNVAQNNRELVEFFNVSRWPDWAPTELYCHSTKDFMPFEEKYPF